MKNPATQNSVEGRDTVPWVRLDEHADATGRLLGKAGDAAVELAHGARARLVLGLECRCVDDEAFADDVLSVVERQALIHGDRGGCPGYLISRDIDILGHAKGQLLLHDISWGLGYSPWSVPYLGEKSTPYQSSALGAEHGTGRSPSQSLFKHTIEELGQRYSVILSACLPAGRLCARKLRSILQTLQSRSSLGQKASG